MGLPTHTSSFDFVLNNSCGGDHIGIDYNSRKHYKNVLHTSRQMVRKASKDCLQPQELLQQVREHDHRTNLPPAEYEALMEMGPELARPPTYDSQCFVLGSYNEDANEKQKLIYFKEELQNWAGENCRAYLMEDFPDGLHPMIQFKLIADHSDYIIGICEHDKGGFQLELGMLIALMEYFDRCHLLKRTYPDEQTEHEKYNWMLSAGVFDMFEYGDRLWEWENSREYKVEVTNVLSTVLK